MCLSTQPLKPTEITPAELDHMSEITWPKMAENHTFMFVHRRTNYIPARGSMQYIFSEEWNVAALRNHEWKLIEKGSRDPKNVEITPSFLLIWSGFDISFLEENIFLKYEHTCATALLCWTA